MKFLKMWVCQAQNSNNKVALVSVIASNRDSKKTGRDRFILVIKKVTITH